MGCNTGAVTQRSKRTIFSWFGYDLSVEERCRLIKETGFDGITVWWDDDMDRIDFRAQPGIARKTGLFVENAHAPYTGNTRLWFDGIDGDEVERRLIGCVEDCAAHEIPVMVVHPTSGNPPPVNEIALHRFGRILERAHRQGVRIALENLRHMDHLRYLFDNLPSDALGFCYDSGHRHSKTPGCDLLSEYSSRLMALHLHDNDGSEDWHALPFDGTIDWDAEMRAIQKAGYAGATTLEVLPFGREQLSAEQFLTAAYDRAVRLDERRHNLSIKDRST